MINQKEEPKQLTYFDVKTEVITTIDVTYKVLAEDVEEAIKKVKEGRVFPSYIGKPKSLNKFRKICVYISGTINCLFAKSY